MPKPLEETDSRNLREKLAEHRSMRPWVESEDDRGSDCTEETRHSCGLRPTPWYPVCELLSFTGSVQVEDFERNVGCDCVSSVRCIEFRIGVARFSCPALAALFRGGEVGWRQQRDVLRATQDARRRPRRALVVRVRAVHVVC